jgi:arginine exporter protein ArgO
MDIIYICIMFLAIHALASTRINTDNVVKLVGLAFIFAGAFVDQLQLHRALQIYNPMTSMGLVFYFAAEAWHAHFRKRTARKGD